jgi:carboxypeptidase family protein
MRHSAKLVPVAVIACLLGAALAWAAITGSIAGVVTDPNGGVIVGAKVAAIETQTGVRTEITTDSKGFYNFPALSVGKYDIEVRASGFKVYRQTGLVVDVNSAMTVDVKLQVGEVSEKVTVMSDAVHVETESTQNGEVISGTQITTVPLNGRAFTDLLSLQPGVVPSSFAKPVQKQFGGLTDRNVSGDLNPGNQSINGQRQAANGFMVNGSNVEEGKNNGAGIIPNLDSIAEFRIITNNFDAEYGNYSGGQVNVVTKSGTNAIHGTAFEFLRNTALDARNFFAPPNEVDNFKQNQFGGAVGGPIKKDKIFFFADYQGTRTIRGQVLNNNVPGLADRPDTNGGSADVSDIVAGLSSFNTVSGANWATILNQRLGRNDIVAGITPYFGCGPGAPPACVFPNNIIPSSAIDPAALGLLPFIPRPNGVDPLGNPNFSSASENARTRDDKGAIHLDANTRFGMLSAYYTMDDYTRNDPYPNATLLGGAVSAPGFGSVTPGRAQLITLGDVKTFGSTSLNEFRFSFVRIAGSYFKPQGGLGPSLTSLGFTAASGTGATFNGGIAPIDPTLQGVPQLTLGQQGVGLSIGVPQDTQNAYNNTYQVLDNFSKVIGTHTIKFGGQFHYDQINERNFFGENGAFSFGGAESGSDFVDFLMGAPDNFIQASKQILDSRSKYAGLFVQDSWRARSSLTLNYGLRWEFSQPWYDTQGKIETALPQNVIAGKASTLYPGAPLGLVVPGDPGVPSTLAPTQYDAFGPRVGLAYSPAASSGFLSKLTGGPGKTSIRAGFGIYYSSVEDLSQFLGVGDAPFGIFWFGSSPLLGLPFVDRLGGGLEGQPFPFSPPPLNVSARNPDTSFNWAQVGQISSNFYYDPHARLPYSEHYHLSIQRQLGSKTIASIGFVGNQGHRNVTSVEANPGNPALCVFLSNPGNLDTGSPTCGPGNEAPSAPFVLPPGAGFPTGATPIVEMQVPCLSNPAVMCNAINSTRTIFGGVPTGTFCGGAPCGASFGTNPYVSTVANSAYNSLQTSLKYTGSRGEFLAGYTYSKCMDNGSSLQDATNVFNPKLTRSLCAFDLTHNFVASYSVHLPFENLFHANQGWGKKVAGGWQVSGITTYATGIPVTIQPLPGGLADQSLIGTVGFGWNVDQASRLPGKILNNTDPRSGQTYFNTSIFVPEGCVDAACTGGAAIGSVGNANRRFFHGPGIANWDMALLKETPLTETKSLEFRFEAFNIFNHAQFQNPGGTFSTSSFGVVTAANDPRLMQVALKFRF